MDRLGHTHLMAAYRVLRYLKRAPSQGILFHSQSKLCLKAYVNNDWVGYPDSRKFVIGFSIFLDQSLFS